MRPSKFPKITDLYKPVLPKRSGVLSVRHDNSHLGGGIKQTIKRTVRKTGDKAKPKPSPSNKEKSFVPSQMNNYGSLKKTSSLV
jgi:hypothetical protein